MCENDRFHGCKRHFDENGVRSEGGEMKEHGHCAERRERFRQFYSEASVNDKLTFNLRSIAHTMRSRFEQNAGQKRILVMLSEQEKLTQRELTEQLGIRPGSASEILSKLENAGLIARAQNGEDRRTVDVTLTEAGKELAAEAAEKRHQHGEEMFTCLTSEEQETLLALLEKIRADWETRYPGHHGRHGHHGPHGRHGECGCHRHGRHDEYTDND